MKKPREKKEERKKTMSASAAASSSTPTAHLSIDEALTLHRALHVPGATTTPALRGGAIAAGKIERKTTTKLRYVRLPAPFALEIVEQNPAKVSKWAKLAASG